MNTSLYIAKRYLFAKKSTNAINIISAISAIGVFVGSAALIIILSVFNGFEVMVLKMFNTITPEIMIVPAQGKTFDPNTKVFKDLKNDPAVFSCTEVLAENALIWYDNKQCPALIKGVSDDFLRNPSLDTVTVDGKFLLHNQFNQPLAVVGSALQSFLGVNPADGFSPMQIYSPKKGVTTGSANPLDDFVVKNIQPAGVFEVQQEFDNMVIVPLSFARSLLGEEKNISQIEINLNTGRNVDGFRDKAAELLGKNYIVKNRIEQNEALYHVLGSEKWMVYIILTFILIIAIFNIIGSLTMLVIDKLPDIAILNSLGAERSLIRKIFLLEGMMITLLGCTFGLAIGFIFCFLQQRYGWIKMGEANLMMSNAYPISFKWADFLLVFLTVGFFSFIASALASNLSVKQVDRPSKGH